MFKAITVGPSACNLAVLQGVLQNSIPLKTLTLLVKCRIKQRLFNACNNFYLLAGARTRKLRRRCTVRQLRILLRHLL